MAVTGLTRLYRNARRIARRQWYGLRVTFRGNRVTRHLDTKSTLGLRPILLLQGFGSTRHALLVLEKRLRSDGFDVLSLRLGGLFGTLNTRTIDKVAHDVLHKIEKLRAEHGFEKITIVGHSKGGLIARYLVACLGGAAHIGAIITLGTPHQGMPPQHMAKVARLSFAMPSVRQMRPTSKFFRTLQDATMPPDVACVSIHSYDDAVVPPHLAHWEIGRGTGTPPRNIILDGISHTDYLIKQRAYEAIRQCL